jgi:hypothetical protein
MPSFPQGELKFVQMLKEREVFVDNWPEDIQVGANDCDLRKSVKVINNFPDDEKLLVTAFEDLDNFLSDAKLNYKNNENFVEFEVSFTAGFEHEEYHFIVTANKVTILASDTEGARRGIYYFQHQVAGSPVLKEGTTVRKAWLKNRISRCFFGPIKRPPFNIDELMNDIDYYPEAYLSRLASEGVNGLWLTVEFKDICHTSIRAAHPDADKRIAKLKKTKTVLMSDAIKIFQYINQRFNEEYSEYPEYLKTVATNYLSERLGIVIENGEVKSYGEYNEILDKMYDLWFHLLNKYGSDGHLRSTVKIFVETSLEANMSMPVNGKTKIHGKIDLLVVEGDRMDIYELKVSKSDTKDWHTSKTLTTRYQLGFYGRIINNLGINTNKTQYYVIPIVFNKNSKGGINMY